MSTQQNLAELFRLLSDPEEQRTQQVHQWLEAMDLNEALSILHEAVTISQNSAQCRQIISLLSYFQDKRSIALLVQLLSAKHPLVNQSALRTLTEFQIPEVYKALLAALSQATSFIVPHIIKSLGKSGYKPAIPVLMELVETTDADMLCYLAIEALGCLGATQATDLIQSYLNHENHHVRAYAAKALDRLTAIYQGEEPSCS